MRELWLLYRYYPLRTILSLMGIVIGIMTLTMLKNIEMSMNAHTEKLMERQGKRLGITIVQSEFLLNKISQWEQEVGSQFSVFSIGQIPIEIRYHNKVLPFEVVSISPNLFEKAQWEIKEGRALKEIESYTLSTLKVAVIGAEVPVPLNDWISVGGEYYQVVGALKSIEFDPVLNFDPNYAIFLEQNMIYRWVKSPELHHFVAYFKDSNINKMENLLKSKMQAFFPRKQFFIKNPIVLQKSLYKQMELTQLLLKSISFITLILGACSTLNLFLILFEERRSELGLRLAMGATMRNLAKQWMTEMMGLGLVGATIGIILGEGGGKFIACKLNLPFYWQCEPVIDAMMISIGIILGVASVPLIRIVKKRPIDLI